MPGLRRVDLDRHFQVGLGCLKQLVRGDGIHLQAEKPAPIPQFTALEERAGVLRIDRKRLLDETEPLRDIGAASTGSVFTSRTSCEVMVPRWTSGSVHLGSSADAWASIESACAKARAAPLGSGTIRVSACRRLASARCTSTHACGLEALCRCSRRRTSRPALAQEYGGLLGQRVTEQQVLGGRLLEARPLEFGAARGVNQPHGDSNPILFLFHTSLDQGAHLERSCDAVAGHAPATVRQDTVARDDVEFTYLGQLGDKPLSETAREELKRIASTLGLEVEHCDAPCVVTRLPPRQPASRSGLGTGAPRYRPRQANATSPPTMSQVRFGLGASSVSNSAAGRMSCPTRPHDPGRGPPGRDRYLLRSARRVGAARRGA